MAKGVDVKILVATSILALITTVCGQDPREYRNLIGPRNLISPHGQAVVLVSESLLEIKNDTHYYIRVDFPRGNQIPK